MRGLGYESRAELRKDLLADLTGNTVPSQRMQMSIEEAGDDPARLLAFVAGIQEEHLAALRRPAVAETFGKALDLLAEASAALVFGLGPSGAMADYLALQLGRTGLMAQAVTSGGIGLADHPLALRAGDILGLIGDDLLNCDVQVALDRAGALGVPILLISERLGPAIDGHVAVTLDVPHGRSEHPTLHSAILLLIEALVLGLSARNRDRALETLADIADPRAAIDSGWTKRGTRRRRPA